MSILNLLHSPEVGRVRLPIAFFRRVKNFLIFCFGVVNKSGSHLLEKF